jgi:hypothetical protein
VQGLLASTLSGIKARPADVSYGFSRLASIRHTAPARIPKEIDVYKNILIATDGSDLSASAIKQGISLATGLATKGPR